MITTEKTEKQPATIIFPLLVLLACLFVGMTNECRAAGDSREPLCVSGVYPHLAFSSFNLSLIHI